MLERTLSCEWHTFRPWPLDLKIINNHTRYKMQKMHV